MNFWEFLSSFPGWVVIIIVMLNIIALIILVISKTNLKVGNFSIITKKEEKESNNNELRLTIFTEIRSYEPYLDNIESLIFNAFCLTFIDLKTEERLVLNHFSNEIRYKLENKLIIDIIANNFRELNEEDLKIYISNKSQIYHYTITNIIIDNNDSTLPHRDLSKILNYIKLEDVFKIYNSIYRGIIDSNKITNNKLKREG